MPDIVIGLLIGFALGFGVGYGVRDYVSAPPPPSRAKRLLERPINCPSCNRGFWIFDFDPSSRRTDRALIPGFWVKLDIPKRLGGNEKRFGCPLLNLKPNRIMQTRRSFFMQKLFRIQTKQRYKRPIYDMVRRRTRDAFGFSVNLHRFRHAAVTFGQFTIRRM
jgi:hypothetical protein